MAFLSSSTAFCIGPLLYEGRPQAAELTREASTEAAIMACPTADCKPSRGEPQQGSSPWFHVPVASRSSALLHSLVAA